MSRKAFNHKASHLLPVILASFLAACGGSSGTGSPSGNSSTGSSSAGTGSGATDTLTSMTMSCPDGIDWQCSGSSIISINNGIALTRSGVQAYGRSTSDMLAVNPNVTGAFGLAQASGGRAEMRIRKDAAGNITRPTVILDKMDITWDGRTDRPIIIETFMTSAGRVEMDSNGVLSFRSLPPRDDLTFWDVGIKHAAATKINYANNSYFPRADPSRCPADLIPCPTTESAGVRNTPGNWRQGGLEPDLTVAGRLHEDGDTFAGNGAPDANGNPTLITTSTGPGIPFPGSKGYRTMDNWSLQYANLANWSTTDTVKIIEWGGDSEHNKSRRGFIAYGDVTDPAAVPVSGTTVYEGVAYGWYSPDGIQDAKVFRTAVSVSANFSTRQLTVALSNPVTFDAALTPLPLTLTAVANFGASGQTSANYATGSAATATMNGGIGARFFGPAAGGTGPAELAGTLSISNTGTGQIALGGFIARKR